MRILELLLLLATLTLFGACSLPGQDDGRSPPKEQYASADPPRDAAQSERPMALNVNDLRWLVGNSPFIFVGRLSSQNVEKDARGLVITRNRFDVERIIVGESADKTITLTTLGGTMDGQTMRVSNMPQFMNGQRYVIFTDLKRTVYNPVTGNERGVFVVDDTGVYAYDGRALAGVENGLLRFSDESSRNFQAGKPAEKAAVAEEPKVSGNVLSVQRAAVEPSKPMALEAFARAIVEAARR
jgi:hypothetical protein